eukprot:75258_1
MHRFWSIPVVVLISLIINIIQSTVIKTALLTPLKLSDNGANVMFNFEEVSPTDMLWNANVIHQNSWQFIINTDETFGIDTKYDSTITFIINILQANTQDLFFAFTTDNTKYISMSIPIHNSNKPTKIYPDCTFISPTNMFGVGDIAGIQKANRACDIAGGSCNNWKYMLPPNVGMAVETPWPLTFKIKNDIILNELIFSFHSDAFPSNFIQTCRFSQDFISRKGLKIYVAGNKFPDEFSVYSFNITSSTLSPTYTPTPAPTLSPTFPTNKPTKYPTIAPTTTYKPTKYPTISPTFNPTTPYPTSLTHSPSKNPVPAPSPYPTNFPTFEPTISPTLPTFKPSINPTLFPTIFTQTPTLQTKKPTSSPSPYPTEIPTSEPTDFPTNIPTINPSVAPTINPSINPTNMHTKRNTIISVFPTDTRNSKITTYP